MGIISMNIFNQVNSDFSTIDMSSGDTSNNHLGVKVSSMLEFARWFFVYSSKS